MYLGSSICSRDQCVEHLPHLYLHHKLLFYIIRSIVQSKLTMKMNMVAEIKMIRTNNRNIRLVDVGAQSGYQQTNT